MAEYSKTIRNRASEQLRWGQQLPPEGQEENDGKENKVVDLKNTDDVHQLSGSVAAAAPPPGESMPESGEVQQSPARKDNNLLRAPTRSGMRQRRKSPVTVQEWVASLPLPHLLQQRQQQEEEAERERQAQEYEER